MSDSGFAQIRNGRLAWWADGPADAAGDPLVLVHAGVADARMWEPIVPALAARHRVVRFDMRGFGRSLSAKGPFSPAGDLAALLDALVDPAAPTSSAPPTAGSSRSSSPSPTPRASRRSCCWPPRCPTSSRRPSCWRSPRPRRRRSRSTGSRTPSRSTCACGRATARRRCRRSSPTCSATRSRCSCARAPSPTSSIPRSPPTSRRSAVPATVAYADRDVEDFEQVARRLHAELPDATLHEIAERRAPHRARPARGGDAAHPAPPRARRRKLRPPASPPR